MRFWTDWGCSTDEQVEMVAVRVHVPYVARDVREHWIREASVRVLRRQALDSELPMTPADLQVIRERDEAVGSNPVTDICRDRRALLAEVERLQRERDTADSRLALLEPVWEAALTWRDIYRGVTLPNSLERLRDAIDAALAAEREAEAAREDSR